MAQQLCVHLEAIRELKLPEEQLCSECVKTGGRWVHLRTCQSCGITLCCDDSPSRHMTQHNHQTHHPVIISAQPGERWMWCFKDEVFVEY